MATFITWFLVSFVSIGLYKLVELVDSYLRTPYRWKCSLCAFKVCTNSKEIIARVQAGHTHEEVEIDAPG